MSVALVIMGRSQWSVVSRGSFARRSLVEALLREQGRKVFKVQAVTNAGDGMGVLWRRRGLVLADDGHDVPVAIIVARRRVAENAKRVYLAAVQADDLVPVLRLTSVSIVHD